MAKSLSEVGLLPALLTLRQAAEYLGKTESYMYEVRLPRIDMRTPGAQKPSWRYRRSDLDAFIADRLVPAGSNVVAPKPVGPTKEPPPRPRRSRRGPGQP